MKRNFIPGSEWLYLKIYTGHKSADRVLTEHVYPVVLNLLDNKYIDKFFFIRYADPRPHIRLRLFISNPDNYSMVFKIFYSEISQCIDNSLISKITCDTYQRELERYGKNTMEQAEHLFYIDSLAIIKLLSALENSNKDKEEERWLLSLKMIDDMLTIFNYTIFNKSLLMEHCSEIFRQEHGIVGQQYTKQLNEKFRKCNPLIQQMFHGDLEIEYNDIIQERQNQMTPVAKDILNLNRNNQLEVNLNNLIESYMHMTIIRLFRSKNRIYEMVIYHFLCKFYKSEIAKKKYNF